MKPTRINKAVARIAADREGVFKLYIRQYEYEVRGKSETSHTLHLIMDGEPNPRHIRVNTGDIMKVDQWRGVSDQLSFTIYYPTDKEEEATALLRASFDEESLKKLNTATAIRNAWLNRKEQNES